MDASPPEVELAAIKEQLLAVKATVEDIKISVSKILTLDRTVAEVKTRQETHHEKIAAISERVQNLEVRVSTNSAYLNKLKGAIGLTVTILTLIQSAVLAGACWLLSTVVDLDRDMSVMESRMEYVNQEHDRVMRSLIAAKQASVTAVEHLKNSGISNE